jgi:hypothetical protein
MKLAKGRRMKLSEINMKGPYPLTEQDIDANVEKTTGNYVLGYKDKDEFRTQYVGRSDTDLNQRLKDHVAEGYKYFAFSYASSTENAYLKECKLYHNISGISNKIHPAKPEGAPTDLKCPVCRQ